MDVPPASQTPLSAIAAGVLAEQAGVPAGVLCVVGALATALTVVSRPAPVQTKATARQGPPVAPRILGAPSTSIAPVSGSSPRLAAHSRPQRPEGSQA